MSPYAIINGRVLAVSAHYGCPMRHDDHVTEHESCPEICRIRTSRIWRLKTATIV